MIIVARTIRKFDRTELAYAPERVAAVQGLRRSSAAGPQDSRPRRVRTRSAARRAAINEKW